MNNRKNIIINLFNLIVLIIAGCNSPSGSINPLLPLSMLPVEVKNSDIKMVIYDGNGNTGGNVPIDNTIYEEGQTVLVMANIGNLVKYNASNNSYRFIGWNTSADGTGTDYPATGSASLTMGSANVILYAKWKPYARGDIGPAGGIIFFDKGVYSVGWRYLEAAPYNQSVMNTSYYPGNGVSNTGIGTGKNNTQLLVSQGSPAALICYNLTINGYSDWFLPSKDELWKMLTITNIGDFSDSAYWSSSEDNTHDAWCQDFTDKTSYISYSSPKRYLLSVRAIRAF